VSRVPVSLSPQSDALSAAGRTAHDIGLAALLGGNLFGRLAMHPALERISDKSERGEVVNAAWRRYGTVNSLALAALVGGWLPAPLGEARARNLNAREAALVRAKNVAVGAVVVTGVASAVAGVRFGQSAPGGAVPMQTGTDTAVETPRKAARTKRVLNALGRASALSEIALVAINSALAQENFRNPSARRVLRRRW